MLDGDLSYLAVQGAPTLLWVLNTEADLFRMASRVLLPRGGSLVQIVEARWTLDVREPRSAGRLQEDSGRASALARARVDSSLLQATEGVLLASIPRTARVSRKELKAPEVKYQGDPQFKPIDGSQGVQQAVNTDKDIVKFGDLYYLCFQGVWFMSRAAEVPWEVASSIPQEIYTIPASSSISNVTYMTVEDSNDGRVTFRTWPRTPV